MNKYHINQQLRMNTPIDNGTFNGAPFQPNSGFSHLNHTPERFVQPVEPVTVNANSPHDYFYSFYRLMSADNSTGQEKMHLAQRCQHYLFYDMLTCAHFIETLGRYDTSLNGTARSSGATARNSAQLMYGITQLDFHHYQRLIGFVKSELQQAKDQKQYLLDHPELNNHGNDEWGLLQPAPNAIVFYEEEPPYQKKLRLAEKRIEKSRRILSLFVATLPAQQDFSEELLGEINSNDIIQVTFSDKNFWRVFFSNHSFEDAQHLCENIFLGNIETTESIFPCFEALMRYSFLSDWAAQDKVQFTQMFLRRFLPSLSLEEIDSALFLTTQQRAVCMTSELTALLMGKRENIMLVRWYKTLIACQDFHNAQNILSYLIKHNPSAFQDKKYDLLKACCNLFFDDSFLQNHDSLQMVEQMCVDILGTHHNEEALKSNASELFERFLISPRNNLPLALIAAVEQNVPSDHQAFLKDSMDYTSNRPLIDIILKKERAPLFEKLITRNIEGQLLYPRFFDKIRKIIPIQGTLCRNYEKLLLNNPQAAEILRDSVYHMDLQALKDVLQGPLLMPERVVCHLFAGYDKYAQGKHPIKPLLMSLSEEQENASSKSQAASTFDMHCAVIAHQCLTKSDVNELGANFKNTIARGTKDNRTKRLTSNGSDVLRIFGQWVLDSGMHPSIDQELALSLSRVLTFRPNLFGNRYPQAVRKSKRLLDREPRENKRIK